MQENRAALRLILDPPVRATLQSQTDAKIGSVINVSESGAFVKDAYAPPGAATVRLSRDRYPAIERACIVLRYSDSQQAPWAAVRFDKPLSNYEVSVLMGTDTTQIGDTSAQTYGLALADYEAVNAELLDIKGCRSRVFIWTIGAVGAISVALWTCFIEGRGVPGTVY